MLVCVWKKMPPRLSKPTKIKKLHLKDFLENALCYLDQASCVDGMGCGTEYNVTIELDDGTTSIIRVTSQSQLDQERNSHVEEPTPHHNSQVKGPIDFTDSKAKVESLLSPLFKKASQGNKQTISVQRWDYTKRNVALLEL